MTATTHRPRKRFSQHFLNDRKIIDRIITSLEPVHSDRIIEIGPGRGALTEPLLKTVAALEVVEIDRDLAQDLDDRFRGLGNLTVHCGDVLKFDFCPTNKPTKVVGNLPYNISTPLLFHLLDHLDCIVMMVLMLQKEVAQRICAGPGSKDYGRLSVMIQSLCRVEQVVNVGSGAFTPPPRVESAVIRLRPLGIDAPEISDRRQFARVVTAAFGKRRKTLRNSLKGLLDSDDMETAGVSPNIRPEQLPVTAFVSLANLLSEKEKASLPSSSI